MINLIQKELQRILDNIQAGNSNITEEQAVQVLTCLREFTSKERPLSKYQACEYLNISRATFDNYVRDGKLPKGKAAAGFKELSWTKKELDDYCNKIKKNK